MEKENIDNRTSPLLFKMMGMILFILLAGLVCLASLLNSVGEDIIFVGLVTAVLMTGAIVFSVYRLVLLPVIRVSRRMMEIAEGDLTERFDRIGNDATGAIAFYFNRFAERLFEMIPKSLAAAQDVSSASSDVMVGSREIMEGAEVQVDAIESISASIGEMNTNTQNVAATSNQLATSSKESADAIHQMAAAVEDIERNTKFLSASVDEASTEILSMSSEIRKIDDNVANLLVETESTSASMVEMDQSLRGTQINIMEMVELAQEVNANAELGRKKVELTQNSIRGIKSFSKEIYEEVRNLEKQTGNIGRFLDVINDMADQTNLLALNAEIIAAQEGEHGRSFSVVANEIKELAERTGASTQEIHEIIKALQSEARRVVEIIAVGDERIDEGVRMAKSAQDALDKIYDSINRSTQRTTMVVNTIEEQSKVIRQVGESMLHMDNRVHEVARATNEQNKKSERIIEAAYRMKSITESLEGAMAPHAKGMKKVKGVTDGVWRVAREIAKETSNQKRQSEEIVRAIHQIKTVTRQTVDTMSAMGGSVEKLIKQAKILEEEIADVKLNCR
jgi:methyl-accepting chemotaxis protein